jgi:biotin-(acetyl-CoA carboxylase) ligase
MYLEFILAESVSAAVIEWPNDLYIAGSFNKGFTILWN